jgi:hypothetical protein
LALPPEAILVFNILQQVLRVDEVNVERLPDGRTRVTFMASGLGPTAVKLKAWLWSVLLTTPLKKIDELTVEEVHRGTVFKRYKVTAVVSPFIEGVKRDWSVGLREALEGRVIGGGNTRSLR